jgi:hypothetical protein
MVHRTGCLICGEELAYTDESEKHICFYCNQTFESNVTCNSNHYVCDGCHRLGANDLIETFTVNTRLQDPSEQAMILMRNPEIMMHGPEHHFLIAAVLISAYYNVKKNMYPKTKQIPEARKRAEMVPGGYCGTHGTCGAAIATGIFVSMITGSTPLAKEEWKLSNLAASETLRLIAVHGGPRCCKKSTFLALKSAVRFTRENFNIGIPLDDMILCEFYPMNKECLGMKCPYYPGK